MDRLFSPWRSKYIDSFADSEDATKECVLCSVIQENDDEKNLIIGRSGLCYVIMNLYPYNSGHIMIVPYRHVGTLPQLSSEETYQIMDLLQKMITSIEAVSHPDGFNIGSNIGRVAGAGIDKHIHFHLVPRWNGDTNFMPVLTDTKMISEDMRRTYQKIKTAFDSG